METAHHQGYKAIPGTKIELLMAFTYCYHLLLPVLQRPSAPSLLTPPLLLTLQCTNHYTFSTEAMPVFPYHSSSFERLLSTHGGR